MYIHITIYICIYISLSLSLCFAIQFRVQEKGIFEKKEPETVTGMEGVKAIRCFGACVFFSILFFSLHIHIYMRTYTYMYIYIYIYIYICTYA